MKFLVHGPFELPRGNKGLIVKGKQELASVWEEVECAETGLANACGCYVFTIQTSGRGTTKPWYVGKSEKTNFQKEALNDSNILKFNQELDKRKRAKPMLFLLPYVDKREKFKPVAEHEAIRELETMLIGMAIRQNPELINIKGTKTFRDLQVAGFMNMPGRSKPRSPSKALRDVFGLSKVLGV